MSRSGSQAVCQVSRRVSRTVSRALRFVHQSQTSGRNRVRFARRNSPKKPPESKPKSTKNRSQEAPGAPKIDSKSTSGRPGCFRVVLGASQSVPGAPRERPKGVPGEARGVPRSRRGSKKSAQEGPKPPQSMQNRSQIASESGKNAKNRVFFALRVREASSERFFVDFCRFSVFSQSAKCLFRTTPASKNRGSALRAASLVARLLQPRQT